MGAWARNRVLQALAKPSGAYVHLVAFSGAVTAKQNFSSLSPVHTNHHSQHHKDVRAVLTLPSPFTTHIHGS